MSRPAACPASAKAGDHVGVVGDDRDVGAAGEVGEPLELRRPDDVEGQQEVADAGVGHHLGLAELLHGVPVAPSASW